MQLIDIQEGVLTPTERTKRLDREKWHKPLISIVVTHHDYSAHLEDALLSILDQTHENWECVVVDDASTPDHRTTAETIVNELGCKKIRFLALEENVGQIPAFFAGLDVTTGEFVCILDPDDRYVTTFIEEMLSAHLNETIFCPLVCCDQRLLKDGLILSGVNTPQKKKHYMTSEDDLSEVPTNATSGLLYCRPDSPGWHWSSTSSMMFRRSALKLLRPYKPLAYKREIDAYLAHGAHPLGGTLFLTKSLVYRGLHDANAYLTNSIFALTQNMRGPQAGVFSQECRIDVLDAISHNGGGAFLVAPKTSRKSRKRRGTIARWGRSIGKRLKKLAR